MKSFHQFQEDSTSDTQAAIGSPGGIDSSAPNIENKFNTFKKRPKTGIARAAWNKSRELGKGAVDKIKGRLNRPKPTNDGPGEQPAREPGKGAVDKIKGRLNRPKPTNDGPGEQPAREPNTYRQKSQQKQLPPGAEKRALPPGKSNLSRNNQGVQKVKVRIEPQRALPPGKEKRSMVQQRTAAANQPPQHKQIDARPASTAMAGSRQKPAIRPGAERKALPPGRG